MHRSGAAPWPAAGLPPVVVVAVTVLAVLLPRPGLRAQDSGPPTGPPTFSSVPDDANATLGKSLGGDDFDVDAKDTTSSTSTIAYKLINAPPAGAQIDNATGQFTWTPAFDQRDSTYTITVEATINGGPSDSLSAITAFAITVETKKTPVQFLHNAADPNAETVDLYFYDEKAVDDLSFRSATAFRPVPAVVDLEVGIAPGSSSGPDDVYARQTITFSPDSSYTAMLHGVRSPGDFADNPNNTPIGIQFSVQSGAKQGADGSGIALRAAHGATDLGPVDLRTTGPRLFGGLSYPTLSSGYKSVATGRRGLALTPTDTSRVIGSFWADLSGRGGAAATVMASGFEAPSANQEGPPLRLVAAFANGDTVPFSPNQPPQFTPASVPPDTTVAPGTALGGEAFALDATDPNGDPLTLSLAEAPDGATLDATTGQFTWTPTFDQRDSTYQVTVRATDDLDTTSTAFAVSVQAPTAQAQFLHNAADPGLSTVDLYLGDEKVADNVSFRSGTPFVDVPAGGPVSLGLAPKNSQGPADTLFAQTETFAPGSAHIVVANGVRAPGNFVANPNGRDTGLRFFVRAGARQSAPQGQVALRTLHGVTDAPTLDVKPPTTSLFGGLTYGDASGYQTVTAEKKLLVVSPTGSGSVIKAFQADTLSSLGGLATTLLASGFRDASARNQGGPPFRLLAALPNGAVIPLQQNRPPQFTNFPGAVSLKPKASIDTTIAASDPDGDPVTLTRTTPLPDGATFADSTGQFRWTPTLAQRDSTYRVGFRASDGRAVRDTTLAVTVTTGRTTAQFIHGTAAPSIATVDLYFDDVLWIDDLSFRAATSPSAVPTGIPIEVGLAPGDAQGPDDVVATQRITFSADSSYTVVPTGLPAPDNFADNPSGAAVSLEFLSQTGTRTQAEGNQVALRPLHTITDAPNLDIALVGPDLSGGQVTLFKGLGYGSIAGSYKQVTSEDQKLVLNRADTSETLAAFRVNLSTLAGQAGMLLASGFLSPAENQDGPAVGLALVRPDGSVVSFDPAPVQPDSLTIDLSRSFDGGRQPEDYRLVGLPGRVDLPMASTLPGESPDDWRAFFDNGDDLVEYDGSSRFRFRPGRGFWLISENGWSVSRSVAPVALTDQSSATIPLHDGWNIISNPLGRDVAWAAVQDANGTSGALFRWTGATYRVDSTFASAQRGRAYYFRNDGGLDTLRVPAPASPSSAAKGAGDRPPRTLRLTAEADGRPVAAARVGTHPAARPGRDPLDHVSPPQYFGSTSLSVANDRIDASAPLTVDVRPTGRAGHSYTLRLDASVDTSLTLRAAGTDRFPANRQIRLYDPTWGRTHDLRSERTVSLSPGEEPTEYTLLIGRSSYVQDRVSDLRPTAFRVRPNYPNPFRDRTRITYTLPETRSVSIRIYDLLGRHIHTLVGDAEREAGRHTVTWGDETGLDVASGTYLARIRAGNQTRTLKLTVVK